MHSSTPALLNSRTPQLFSTFILSNARIRAHLDTGTALHTGVVVNTVINIVFLDRMGGADSPAGPA